MRLAVRLIISGLSLAVLARLLTVVWDQIWFPFDMGFETPGLSTIRMFKEGIDPYSDDTYAHFPFNLTLYPPLYHLLVAVLPANSANPFFTGRLVAFISMVAASGALFAVSNIRRLWVLPVLGISVFFCFPSVISNSAFLKNDTLALCFSAWAVIAVSRTGTARRAHLIAALLAVLALGAKQSYGAAFLACACYLLVQHRAKAIEFGALWLSSLVALCAIAHFVWGDGFWFSTVTAPANPINWGQTRRLIAMFLGQPVFGILTLITVTSAAAGFMEKDTTKPTASPFFLYALFSGLLLLLTVGKVGASTNYFFEFILAQTMWLIDAKRGGIDAWLERPACRTILASLTICIAINLWVTDSHQISFLRVSSQFRTNGGMLWQETMMTEGIHEPVVLNLDTHVFTYEMQGHAVLNDPFLYRILWSTGVLENGPMLKAIRQHAFDIVVTRRRVSESLVADLPMRQIQEQVLKSYQYWRHGWFGEYYRPR